MNGQHSVKHFILIMVSLFCWCCFTILFYFVFWLLDASFTFVLFSAVDFYCFQPLLWGIFDVASFFAYHYSQWFIVFNARNQRIIKKGIWRKNRESRLKSIWFHMNDIKVQYYYSYLSFIYNNNFLLHSI